MSKILIVEDNSLILKIWRGLLEKEGFSIVDASTGNEAIERAKTETPDVILLDIILPERHGFEIFQTLKLFEETKNIPVIFLTSLDRDSDREKAEELGAAGYFVKSPKISQELISRLNELIKNP